MVLYYMSATREPDDIKNPNRYLMFHCCMKNFQLGMVGGCALGVLGGLMRRNFRAGTVFIDTTKSIAAGGALGALYGIPQTSQEYGHLSIDDKREKAFKIQKSLWHNRMDILTIGGLCAGTLVAPTRVWSGFLEFAGAEALPRVGCFVWTCFGGFLLDIPLVIAGVLYYAHVDDIDIAGCKKEDEM